MSGIRLVAVFLFLLSFVAFGYVVWSLGYLPFGLSSKYTYNLVYCLTSSKTPEISILGKTEKDPIMDTLADFEDLECGVYDISTGKAQTETLQTLYSKDIYFNEKSPEDLITNTSEVNPSAYGMKVPESTEGVIDYVYLESQKDSKFRQFVVVESEKHPNFFVLGWVSKK
jgi:hypothetical protein